jgi:hypothetical protein
MGRVYGQQKQWDLDCILVAHTFKGVERLTVKKLFLRVLLAARFLNRKNNGEKP